MVKHIAFVTDDTKAHAYHVEVLGGAQGDVSPLVYLRAPAPRSQALGIGETFGMPGPLPIGIQRIYRVIAVDAQGYECAPVALNATGAEYKGEA